MSRLFNKASKTAQATAQAAAQAAEAAARIKRLEQHNSDLTKALVAVTAQQESKAPAAAAALAVVCPMEAASAFVRDTTSVLSSADAGLISEICFYCEKKQCTVPLTTHETTKTRKADGVTIRIIHSSDPNSRSGSRNVSGAVVPRRGGAEGALAFTSRNLRQYKHSEDFVHEHIFQPEMVSLDQWKKSYATNKDSVANYCLALEDQHSLETADRFYYLAMQLEQQKKINKTQEENILALGTKVNADSNATKAVLGGLVSVAMKTLHHPQAAIAEPAGKVTFRRNF